MRWKNKKQRKFWERINTRWNKRKKLKKQLKEENVGNKMKNREKEKRIWKRKKSFLKIWLIYAWHFSKSTKYKFMFLKFI